MGRRNRFKPVWEAIDAAMKTTGAERRRLMVRAMQLLRESAGPPATAAISEPLAADSLDGAEPPASPPR